MKCRILTIVCLSVCFSLSAVPAFSAQNDLSDEMSVVDHATIVESTSDDSIVNTTGDGSNDPVTQSQSMSSIDISAEDQHKSWLSRTGTFLKGEPIGTNVYLGLWSYHFKPSARANDNQVNKEIGVSYKGFYATTFENSYYNQTYSVGIQRTIWQHDIGQRGACAIGYRAGIMYGYDRRLSTLAGVFKYLPFTLPYFDLQFGHVGAEFQYFWSGASMGFFVPI